MTICYTLFNRPGNINEFLDKMQKNDIHAVSLTFRGIVKPNRKYMVRHSVRSEGNQYYLILRRETFSDEDARLLGESSGFRKNIDDYVGAVKTARDNGFKVATNVVPVHDVAVNPFIWQRILEESERVNAYILKGIK